jgi:hypothetical protein
MNAAPLTRSFRALIIATGLIAASSVVGYAQDAPLTLGAQATIPLTQLYLTPPTGQAILGGHTFDLAGGNLIQLSNGQSASFTGSYPNATTVYLLLNTFNTYLFFDGMPVGQVVLTFSDGTTQTTDLTVGTNIREWRTGAGATVNWVLAGAGSTEAWSGSAQPGMGGGPAAIDMLTVSIATAGKTLTGVTINDTNSWGTALKIDLAGVTVAFTAPTPTPTPTPTPAATGCGKVAQNGKLVAQKSQGCLHRAEPANSAQTDRN